MLVTFYPRWEHGSIYSIIGSVLIAVNPYKPLFELKDDGSKESIYSDAKAAAYLEGKLTLSQEPHVFGVAANAVRNLLTTKKPQCIVISGDSGAGNGTHYPNPTPTRAHFFFPRQDGNSEAGNILCAAASSKGSARAMYRAWGLR